MGTTAKFSEDVITLSDVKKNPGRIVRQIDETSRPVLLTNRGRGVAVIQSLGDYEAGVEERDFLRDVVKGLMDIEAGDVLDLGDVKSRLGLS